MVQHYTLVNHIWLQDVILHVYIQQAHVHFCLCLLIQLRVLFVVCVHVCCADLYIIRKICFIQLILQMLQITNTNKLHNVIYFYNKKYSLSFDSQVETSLKYSEFSFAFYYVGKNQKRLIVKFLQNHKRIKCNWQFNR